VFACHIDNIRAKPLTVSLRWWDTRSWGYYLAHLVPTRLSIRPVSDIFTVSIHRCCSGLFFLCILVGRDERSQCDKAVGLSPLRLSYWINIDWDVNSPLWMMCYGRSLFCLTEHLPLYVTSGLRRTVRPDICPVMSHNEARHSFTVSTRHSGQKPKWTAMMLWLINSKVIATAIVNRYTGCHMTLSSHCCRISFPHTLHSCPVGCHTCCSSCILHLQFVSFKKKKKKKKKKMQSALLYSKAFSSHFPLVLTRRANLSLLLIPRQ